MSPHLPRPPLGSPLRARLLLVFRLEPEAARRHLPGGWAPSLERGAAIGLVTYTNLGASRGRFLPPRRASTHHLVFGIAAVREGSVERAVWVHRRATSSRRGARWNERILRLRSGGTSFLFESEADALELRARGADGSELYLRARVGGRSGSLFPTALDVQRLLATAGELRPSEPRPTAADRIEPEAGLAPEPLSVFELRGSFFADGNGARLDGAWSLSPVRRRPLHRASGALSARRRLLAVSDQALPALIAERSLGAGS